MKAPYITVLMSVFNGSKFLPEAIDSILSQSYKDFEFLIIDDGSSDKSVNIIQSYTKIDSRIRFIRHSKNLGLVASLNEGIAKSRGLYIARMDCDDASSPDRLEKMLLFVQAHPDVALVGSAFNLISEHGKLLGTQGMLTDHEDLVQELSLRNAFGHGTVLFQKAAVVALGGYHDLECVEDYDLWLRISEKHRVAGIPEVLYNWRISPDGISQSNATAQNNAALKLASSFRKNHYPNPSLSYLLTQKQYYKKLSRHSLERFRENQRLASDRSKQLVRTNRLLYRLLLVYSPIKWLAKAARTPLRFLAFFKPLQRKRVLIVRNAFSYDFGGAETYTLNLARCLKNEGFEPLLVTRVPRLLAKADEYEIHSIVGKWREHQVWDKKYYLIRPYVTLWYVYILLRHRISLVNPQGRDDFMFASTAAQWLHKPVVWTDHADLKYIFSPNSPTDLRRRMHSAAKKASAIICVSNSEKLEILKVAPELQRLHVIHNGVFKPQPNSVTPVEKKGGLIIGTTSRLVKAKGIRELIEAFSQLDSGVDLELWLVGDGPDKHEFELLVKKLGLKSRVHFWGYTERPLNYLASMDIFVHSSYHEAFSLAIIEACMMNRAVIATAVGGTPEIITEKTGLLVQPRSTEQLVSALNKLISEPALREKLAANAGNIARQKYDFENIVHDKITPLYQKALKRSYKW